MQTINRFNIRVYGLLINSKKEILLVNEMIGDKEIVKFPGGGLEFGEGTKDCIIREFKEETILDIEVIDHFYTTDFFQQSAFSKTDQIISIYYTVKTKDDTSTIRLDEFELNIGNRIEHLRFFWVPLLQLTDKKVTFPIDKKICSILNRTHLF
jgi:ADP-ribose pyrophosphatase YjhB (NUDIX family)